MSSNVSVHRGERTIIVKFEMFMNCSKNFTGIWQKQI